MSTVNSANNTARRHVVCPIDELPPGQRKIIQIGRIEIGVFNIADTFYGLRNVCPHRAAPVCKGRVRPLVMLDEEGEIAYREDEMVIKCPWHLWEFDMRSGCSIHDETLRLKTYEVCREGDEVVVYV